MEKSKKAMSTWIPKIVEDDIKKLVNLGRYNNRADFIRIAIREKLRREVAE